MTEANIQADAAQGIAGVMLENRERVVRFLLARGAGDSAEDIYQDLWERLSRYSGGPVADPMSYIMRAANNLMLDRYRSSRQANQREKAWGETTAAHEPTIERSLISREQLAEVERVIAASGERPATVFQRYRVDGQSQRHIAASLGVSVSTVEADLRKVYAALAGLKRQFDGQ